MKNPIYILVILGLIAASVFYWLKRADENTLEAVMPIRGPVVQAVYASGTAEPTIMLPIAPRSGARLTALLKDEGADVMKGEALAHLENADLLKALEEQQAQLDLAKKDYERKAGLRKSGAISKLSFDTAQTNLDAAQAALEQTEAQLEYLQLTAPEDGRIIRRDGEVGEYIPAGQAVFWMECCAPMRITAEVDEEDIPLVAPGQRVMITADAFPGDTFEGTVQSITPKGDDVARSFRVRIGLPEDTPLMTGMTAETNIITRTAEDAILVPASAVRNNKIWLVRAGKLTVEPVKIGAQTTTSAEILSGITESDIVLKHPAGDMPEGHAVSYKLSPWALRE